MKEYLVKFILGASIVTFLVILGESYIPLIKNFAAGCFYGLFAVYVVLGKGYRKYG